MDYTKIFNKYLDEDGEKLFKVEKTRSSEMMEYRMKIMDLLCQDRVLQLLLTDESERQELDDYLEEADSLLPYNHIYPHEYVPGMNMKDGKFLNFEIQSEIDPRNGTFKDMDLYFFCICHEDLVRVQYKGRDYCWFDLVAARVDNIFGGANKDIGVGKCTIKSNEPYYVSYAANIPYKGRTLIFEVKEFTDSKQYGKKLP